VYYDTWKQSGDEKASSTTTTRVSLCYWEKGRCYLFNHGHLWPRYWCVRSIIPF
jgi:hypothetical protein